MQSHEGLLGQLLPHRAALRLALISASWRYRVVELYRNLPADIMDLPVGGSGDRLYKKTLKKWVMSNFQ